jgi:choline dehydrogenase-like flavoprotein
MSVQEYSGSAGTRGGEGPGGGSLATMLYREASSGSIELNAQDPRLAPKVRYRYLTESSDRDRLREAVRMTSTIASAMPLASVLGSSLLAPSPATLDDDQDLDAWIAFNLGTALHGCGTTRMGPPSDETAVVDGQGRVHGVQGLRVADLSIARLTPRSATNATAMVIGERAAGFW